MKEHYGVDIPESSVRAVTLGHAHCMKEQAIETLQNQQDCIGEEKQLVGEMDDSMIPIVLIDENAEGDKRKTRKQEWQEAKLCLVYENGSTYKRHRVVMGNPDEAGDHWLSCAIEQGMNRQTTIHCVSDGASWIASQADRVFAGQGNFLVDFYHLCEYLADAAKECTDGDEPKFSSWMRILREISACPARRRLQPMAVAFMPFEYLAKAATLRSALKFFAKPQGGASFTQ